MKNATKTSEAYQFYVETIASRTHKSKEEVMAEVSLEEFLVELHDLHHRYMTGEFSIGKLAELVGVNPFQLDYLLTLLGLAVHN
jgi:hypothetical protein